MTSPILCHSDQPRGGKPLCQVCFMKHPACTCGTLVDRYNQICSKYPKCTPSKLDKRHKASKKRPHMNASRLARQAAPLRECPCGSKRTKNGHCDSYPDCCDSFWDAT